MNVIARVSLNARTRAWLALEARVAAHLGATLLDDGGGMQCPRCGGDYGPTMSLEDLATYEDGYLPAAPLLVGVCLDCRHIHEPAEPYRPHEDEDHR